MVYSLLVSCAPYVASYEGSGERAGKVSTIVSVVTRWIVTPGSADVQLVSSCCASALVYVKLLPDKHTIKSIAGNDVNTEW